MAGQSRLVSGSCSLTPNAGGVGTGAGDVADPAASSEPKSELSEGAASSETSGALNVSSGALSLTDGRRGNHLSYPDASRYSIEINTYSPPPRFNRELVSWILLLIRLSHISEVVLIPRGGCFQYICFLKEVRKQGQFGENSQQKSLTF